MSERLDRRGNRIGNRVFNGPGNGPRRNEAGLAPGLEAVIENTATEIETLALTMHAGRRDAGDYLSCPHECGVWVRVAEKLREGLLEWTGRDTEPYDPAAAPTPSPEDA